jgi:hypothetical protein
MSPYNSPVINMLLLLSFSIMGEAKAPEDDGDSKDLTQINDPA